MHRAGSAVPTRSPTVGAIAWAKLRGSAQVTPTVPGNFATLHALPLGRNRLYPCAAPASGALRVATRSVSRMRSYSAQT